ncbi:MAG: hypothetical protein AAF467_11495 [Actinomycetota bacterium]
MAAPEYVPTDPTQRVRAYSSPPRRPDAWQADRPGDLTGSQPTGDRLGSVGPDQGYAYTLVRHIEDKLHLGDVQRDDAVAGGVAVAMKRAAGFGRAPIVHDLTAAFTVWGFLDENPPAELVALRNTMFAEVRSPHHYLELREVADAVPAEVLAQPPAKITAAYQDDWRDCVVVGEGDSH